MAKTKDGKKRVFVHAYDKGDDVHVRKHYRSTPNPRSESKNDDAIGSTDTTIGSRLFGLFSRNK